MKFKLLNTALVAAFLAGLALMPTTAMAAKTNLTLGAAAADIGNLDPHYSSKAFLLTKKPPE